MGDNHKDEVRKKCPFLDEWCIGDDCACFIQVAQTGVNQLGIQQTVQQGMCSLPALCMIMSSKQVPSQPIKLPQLFQGG